MSRFDAKNSERAERPYESKSFRRNATRSPRRACILVLGMHRSGTSALTRVVNLLRCDLPKTLTRAHETNEAEFWESEPNSQLNERILESAGTTWDDWIAVNPGWLDSPKAEEFRKEALNCCAKSTGRLGFICAQGSTHLPACTVLARRTEKGRCTAIHRVAGAESA
jgi:hypothetical protein